MFVVTLLNIFPVFIADSPYHDVSGLPDPYGEQHHQVEGEENKTQHMALSFDESLESGYSTPNSRSRRIIREIIV
jgi:echinoid